MSVFLSTGGVDSMMSTVEGLLEESHKHVATKADVQAVKSALQSEIAGVRYELKSEIIRSEQKSLMADIKSDLRWLKWLLGIGISLGVIIGTGILLLLLRLAGGL